MSAPRRARLPGGRLHLQHGPIDLIIGARGAMRAVAQAYEQACLRFDDILPSLVRELPLLRTALADVYPLAQGPVARRMIAACWPHRAQFITPMAAVAGGVADEMLAAMLADCGLECAYVNDGGDIAMWVAPGQSLTAGIVNHPLKPALDASLRLERPCGLATSGWRGRSQSLGIADAVTVVAGDAAAADAAATLLANAVNVDHPAISRKPACAIKHDSDLGDRLVTVGVETLPRDCVSLALDRGLEAAGPMLECGRILAAYFSLQGEWRVVPPSSQTGCAKLSAMGGTTC